MLKNRNIKNLYNFCIRTHLMYIVQRVICVRVKFWDNSETASMSENFTFEIYHSTAVNVYLLLLLNVYLLLNMRDVAWC